MCHSAQSFFGLRAGDREVFLEPIFGLMYYCGFTFTEAYKLPIYIRTWFVNRVTRELNRTNESGEQMSTPRHLPPEQAFLLGRNNPTAPSRNARHT